MGRSLNAPFTELRRTGQEAAKTEIFKARAARHYARQHTGPAGRDLTDLTLPCYGLIMYAVRIVYFSYSQMVNSENVHYFGVYIAAMGFTLL